MFIVQGNVLLIFIYCTILVGKSDIITNPSKRSRYSNRAANNRHIYNNIAIAIIKRQNTLRQQTINEGKATV